MLYVETYVSILGTKRFQYFFWLSYDTQKAPYGNQVQHETNKLCQYGNLIPSYGYFFAKW